MLLNMVQNGKLFFHKIQCIWKGVFVSSTLDRQDKYLGSKAIVDSFEDKFL